MRNATFFGTVTLALVSLLLAGCTAKQGKEDARATDKEDVRSTPGFAKQQDLETLRAEIKSLRTQVFQLKARTSRFDSLLLDPTEKGFGRIDTTSGFFLVAVRDLKPYLDGYRLSLAIGNPVAATYEGLKLKFTWQRPVPSQKEGESDEQYSKRYDEWAQSEPHEKEVSFTETLHPASWNTISVVISPATPEELSQLEITSMQTDRVSLSRK